MPDVFAEYAQTCRLTKHRDLMQKANCILVSHNEAVNLVGRIGAEHGFSILLRWTDHRGFCKRYNKYLWEIGMKIRPCEKNNLHILLHECAHAVHEHMLTGVKTRRLKPWMMAWHGKMFTACLDRLLVNYVPA